MRRLALLIFLLGPGMGLCAAPESPPEGPEIYDPNADGFAQIETALQQARDGYKNVLLMFGANWCIWCHRLHQTFVSDAAVARVLRANFILVAIDVNSRQGVKRNAAVNERYGNPIKLGLPVLVVLDATGRPLATQETGAFEEGNHHSSDGLVAFLQRWAPPRWPIPDPAVQPSERRGDE